MKLSPTRRAFLTLGLGAALGVAGCGGGSNNVTSPGATPTPGPAPAASELSGRITYSQVSRGADGLPTFTGYIASADGTQIRPYDVKGLLSPDGTRVALSRYNSETRKSSLYTAAADGSGERLIVEGEHLGSFDWSPDSQTLVYSQEFEREADGGANISIFLASANGTGVPRRFPGAGRVNSSPSFSPDGNSLLYLASGLPDGAVNRQQITLASLDGSNARVLVASDEGLYTPTFSPDGRQIAYTQFVGPSSRFGTGVALYVADRDGRNRRFIAGGTDISTPAYSPDGRFIAYDSGSGRTASTFPDQAIINIYIARADGSSASRLFMPEAGRGSQYLGTWLR